jgi:hypothetical protein
MTVLTKFINKNKWKDVTYEPKEESWLKTWILRKWTMKWLRIDLKDGVLWQQGTTCLRGLVTAAGERGGYRYTDYTVAVRTVFYLLVSYSKTTRLKYTNL